MNNTRLNAIERKVKTLPEPEKPNPFSVFSGEEFDAACTCLKWLTETTQETTEPANESAEDYVSRLHKWIEKLEPDTRAALAEVQIIEHQWKSYGYFGKDGNLENCTTKEETFIALLSAAQERIQDEKAKTSISI